MTQESFDTLDALIARYVAGTLPSPLRALVAAHLEITASSRLLVRALEAAAGDELEAVEPAEIGSRKRMLDAIFASEEEPAEKGMRVDDGKDAIMPRALHDFIGHTVDTIPWRTKMPGFREFVMDDVDGCHVSMFWIRSGRKVPTHTHEGYEVTLVLDGAFSDSRGHYRRGDIAMADSSIEHQPIADDDRPCICFAVTDGPLRLTGPLHRRIADIIGAG